MRRVADSAGSGDHRQGRGRLSTSCRVRRSLRPSRARAEKIDWWQDGGKHTLEQDGIEALMVTGQRRESQGPPQRW
ncbi:MAG: hypothetical protein MZV63_46235 [Marinilabiliales bacterium]|nr:hypothetical protein [Marinilabiliales bacterium]